jgi:2-keto-4-pentenoate hydratase/2-oxohepta-3-ene-1,7-dioic acid hydratase in catechol pathway
VQGRPLRVTAEGDTLVGEDGSRHPLAGARFLPPVVPPNFYAAGLNFRAHIEWANQHHGGSYKVPTQADIGYRSNNALVGHGADIVIPADSAGPVEFEGELVAVIGRQAHHVSEEDALQYVAGYTLGNDVSERTWQRSDRTLWRAKNTDTFKPMGPFVVDGIDPMAQDIEVRINGKTARGARGMISASRTHLAHVQVRDVRRDDCPAATVPPFRRCDRETWWR